MLECKKNPVWRPSFTQPCVRNRFRESCSRAATARRQGKFPHAGESRGTNFSPWRRPRGRLRRPSPLVAARFARRRPTGRLRPVSGIRLHVGLAARLGGGGASPGLPALASRLPAPAARLPALAARLPALAARLPARGSSSSHEIGFELKVVRNLVVIQGSSCTLMRPSGGAY